MPHVRVRGVNLYYEEHGTGPEVIVFAHGCLLSCRQFDGQLAEFRDRYRCIVFDFRGQGKSEVTRGGYDMDSLTEDTAELIRALGCAPCHFVGTSMGGFVGMRLAVRYPTLLKSLVLVGSSATRETNPWGFRLLTWVARILGVRAVADRVMPVQFGRTFLESPDCRGERAMWRERIAANRRTGAARSANGVICRPDFSSQLSLIRTPTLIVVGEEDLATPIRESERMRLAIAGSEMVVVPRAGHGVAIEQPGAVSAAIRPFLDRHPISKPKATVP